MNKQRYLVELQRLLVFMTEEDRELTVRRYGELFDAVGEEGEEELAARIGSPTKTAIGLSRSYEPGQLESVLPSVPSENQPEPEEEVLQDPAEALWNDMPAFELPDLDLETETTDEEKSPVQDESEPQEVPEEPAHQEIRPAPVRPPKPPEPVRETKIIYKRYMPIGIGAVLFIILMIGLGLPLALVCVALSLVCLCPGAAVLLLSWLIFVGGLWCISFMADAILIFGLAFVVLPVAILLLFAGIWVDVHVIRLYIRGVDALGGVLLGRKVEVDA